MSLWKILSRRKEQFCAHSFITLTKLLVLYVTIVFAWYTLSSIILDRGSSSYVSFIIKKENTSLDVLNNEANVAFVDKGYSTVSVNDNQDNYVTEEKGSFRGHDLALKKIPQVHVDTINCANVFAGVQTNDTQAINYSYKPKSDDEYISATSNCSHFVHTRRYVTQAVSQEEADFPIAFSIIVFKDIEQVERLLRAVYRPQNYYCIHVDTKSNYAFHKAIEGIAQCFDNVFLASHLLSVTWGTFTVAEAELICMKELLKYNGWMYFINLTGQEFPLKSNWHLVKVLKSFNGSNNLSGTIARMNKIRTKYVFNGSRKTDRLKEPPPEGVRVTKGSVHMTVTRGFVDFIINNDTAQRFINWTRNTRIPDETIFTSLNHSPRLRAPGSYKGEPETSPSFYPFFTRYKNWVGPKSPPCHGQRVRLVCVFGVGDIPMLAKRPELFANKFYSDFEPLALDCMEELHYNRTREEIQGTWMFDAYTYTGYEFVWNHF